VPNLRISLVEFSNDAFYTNFFDSSANATVLAPRINDYWTVGGTQTHEGIATAYNLLVGSSTADNKIMIIMSDGAAGDPGAANTYAASSKSAGIKIYSAAFGSANATAMNTWSSNSGFGNCDHDYCYQSAGDLAVIYNSIIQDILDSFSLNVNLTLGSKSTSLSLAYSEAGAITYNNQLIDLPSGLCASTPVTRTLSINGLRPSDQFTISNPKINYCPYHPPVAYEEGLVNGNVAGASDNILKNYSVR
jgi:hypothetical protein